MRLDPGAYDVRDIEFNDARRLTEEFISRYGRGSAEPTERRTATAQE